MQRRPAESGADRGGRPASPAAAGRRARAVIGVRGSVSGSEFRVTHVLDGGTAQRAGLAGGDVVVAVDGIRVGTGGIEGALASRQAGESVQLHAFRRDELMVFDVPLAPAPADTCLLVPVAQAVRAGARKLAQKKQAQKKQATKKQAARGGVQDAGARLRSRWLKER